MPPKRVDGLDLLRAVAIALVVADHGALFFFLVHGWPAIWTRLGTVGVTLFFVLSGFLIGGLLLDLGPALREPRAAAAFWLRRALRTLPNYYLFIGVNLGFWGVFQRGRGLPNPLPLLPRYALFLQNFGPTQNWFFPESWSLAVEEWFYLVFPLLLLAGLRLSRQPFRRIYWVLTLLLLLGPPVLRALLLSPEDWARGITNVVIYRPDSIALGLAAVGIWRAHPTAWVRWRRAGGLLGIILLFALYGYLGWGDPDRSALARVFFLPAVSLGCALLLPWASQCQELAPSWLAGSVRCVSRWSYSLYLINLMASTTVLSHMQFHRGTAVGISAYLASCLVLSAAVYHGFEAPILRWRDRVLRKAPASGRPLNEVSTRG